MYLCVQCGETVGSLYIGYSEKNFRLTRCGNCHHVADKYVEYELVLVLIDVLLLRKPALRHLMYNRYDQLITDRVAKLLPVAVLITNICLKVVILQTSRYQSLGLSHFLHAGMVTVLEYAVFGLALCLALPFIPSSRLHEYRSFTRLFLAVLFPEAFRIVAIVLHTFESEPNLLVLLSLLIVAIQVVSLQCVSLVSLRILIGCFALGLAAKILMKTRFYSYQDMWLLGGFT